MDHVFIKNVTIRNVKSSVDASIDLHPLRYLMLKVSMSYDNMIQTRYGRVIRKPQMYTPEDVKLEDDFSDSDYDESESDVSTDISYESEELEDSESDADENGNLAEFIVEENSENNNEESDVESDGESSATSH